MVQLANTYGLQAAGETTHPAGFDGGNTDTCFSTFVNGQERTVVIPSALSELVGNKLSLLRSAVAQVVDGQSDAIETYKQDIQVEYGGKSYLVGYSAMRQSKRANTQKGDDTRYYSVEQLIRLLATSALAIPYSHYELDIVTTAPFGYYTKALRQEIKRTLAGRHDFTINGVERHAYIKVRQVLVEGAPALVLYGAASANSRRIIIDGGGHTTELLAFDGRDPIADLCKGIELGVETIGDYVAAQVLEAHDRRLSIRERSDILRAYGSRNTQSPLSYPEVACGSYSISPAELHAICRAGAINLADATLSEAAMLWGKVNGYVAGDIPHQFHMGGVVHFCNDIMREKMPKLAAVAEAEKANARGCARLAKAMV